MASFSKNRDRYILNIGVICYLTDSLYFSYISTPNGLHSTSKTEIETEEIEITTQSNFGFEEFFIFVKALTKILTV